MTSGAAQTRYRLVARNTSADHLESIHDDSRAKQFGYQGGLVPGVTLYGYMTHILAERWGNDWIQHGWMSSRSVRPAYEGEPITVVATDEGDVVSFEVLRDGVEKPAAVGRGSLPIPTPLPPDADSFRILPMPDHPPLAAVGAIPVGHEMGTTAVELTTDLLETYLSDLDENYAPYRERGVFPPSYFQLVTTHVERANFEYETPTIYVASTAQHFREARVGDVLRCPGRVTGFFERNGNHYVEVEQLVLAADEVIARVTRESIYHARDRREA